MHGLQRFASSCVFWRHEGAMQNLLYFEWTPPWHHIVASYLSYSQTFFVIKSGEDKKVRKTQMKSRVRFHQSYPLLVPGLVPAEVNRWPLQSVWRFFWHIFWHSCWHFFGHSLWHIFGYFFWQSFWHSVWRFFWLGFWLLFWHSFW